MAKITCDANILIKYKQPLPRGFYMSIVVLQELLVGAVDASTVKQLERVRHEYRKLGRLLVPTEDDWWHVGLVHNALQRGRRSKKTGKIPRISAAEKYRITNDVLIARTQNAKGSRS